MVRGAEGPRFAVTAPPFEAGAVTPVADKAPFARSSPSARAFRAPTSAEVVVAGSVASPRPSPPTGFAACTACVVCLGFLPAMWALLRLLEEKRSGALAASEDTGRTRDTAPLTTGQRRAAALT
jgi:hypothetical protein